jgi:hypothetical protein
LGPVGLGLLTILLSSAAALAQTPQPMPPGPPPNPARPPLTPIDQAGENFTFLRDPSNRADLWDPLKYVPLDRTRDFYLTFGFEFRSEYEWFQNAMWGAGPQTISGYWLQRIIPEMSLTLGSHVRMFACSNTRRRWATTLVPERVSTKIKATSMKPLST